MHETLRRLPSLDFLKGFEAAGRHLSFTRAAEELFLTQSALSRQVQALEEALGVPLFVRRHRALALTAAGAAFHRDVAAALGSLISAADAARGVHRTPGLTLSTTVSFASLWVIPRLPAFRARHPDVEVYVSADDRLIDLGRGDVDIAVRYMADANAPDGGVRLFGERMLPVVAPGLAANARDLPLSKPSDLARHVLLHLDDPDGRMPWLDWTMWLDVERPAGTQARRVAAIQALRPGDPGDRRRPGRRAGPHTADRRVPARRSARRAVSEAIRIGARLLRGRGAARGRATRRRARSSAGCATKRRPRQSVATAGEPPPKGGRGPARSRAPRPRSRAMTPEPPSARHDALAAVAVDRPLRAPRSGGRARARSRVRRRAATRGSSRAAAPTCSPSIAIATRWRRSTVSPESRRAGSTSRAADWPFAGERFDAIVVAHYLHRPALPQLIAAVADDGTLLYETFARGNEAYGRPSNPDFLLEPGELLAIAARGSPWSRSSKVLVDRRRAVPSCSGSPRSGGGDNGRRCSMPTRALRAAEPLSPKPPR